MKPGQIRQLYLEPRLHKQSNKKSITTGHVWQSDYIQNKQKPNIELKNSFDQWKLFKGDDVDF
jgi:hypothetical protein